MGGACIYFNIYIIYTEKRRGQGGVSVPHHTTTGVCASYGAVDADGSVRKGLLLISSELLSMHHPSYVCVCVWRTWSTPRQYIYKYQHTQSTAPVSSWGTRRGSSPSSPSTTTAAMCVVQT